MGHDAASCIPLYSNTRRGWLCMPKAVEQRMCDASIPTPGQDYLKDSTILTSKQSTSCLFGAVVATLRNECLRCNRLQFNKYVKGAAELLWIFWDCCTDMQSQQTHEDPSQQTQETRIWERILASTMAKFPDGSTHWLTASIGHFPLTWSICQRLISFAINSKLSR